MPTTYAAYSNLHAPNLSTPYSSQPTSQRTSITSETSTTSPKKSRWQRFLDELKPVETPLPPTGFFTKIPPYPAREKKVARSSAGSSRRASRVVETVKSVAGERHSPRARA